MSFKLPEKTKYVHSVDSIRRDKAVTTIMDDAVGILGDQIERYRLKSKASTFGEKDVKALRQLISALVELSREEREREKADDLNKVLAGMSDEQLLEYAQNALLKAK